MALEKGFYQIVQCGLVMYVVEFMIGIYLKKVGVETEISGP
jgi:hypothetical protein